MYHLVKPLREWEYHDCRPEPNASPKDYANGEPCFDIHDVRPMAGRGHDYLNRIYRDMEREHDREHSRHAADAARYAMPQFTDWGTNNKPKRKKKMSKMTHNKAMADALLDNFHTVVVSFDGALWTYKIPKDLELEKDDLVIVPRNKKMHVAVVREAHNRVKNRDELNLKWIVQKIDTTVYNLHVEQDEKAMETILELEKRKTKRELVAELTGDLDATEMKKLEADLGIQAIPALSKD